MSPGSLNNTRGFTLIEVAVNSAVLLLLMGGVYFVVSGGMRYLRLAQAHQTVNQQASIGMRKIVSEVVNTSQSAVYQADAPQDYLLFLSPLEPKPSASNDYTYQGTQLEWKKWVCFYRNGANQIVRAELALAAPTLDPATEAAPDFAADILPLAAQPIAQNVAEIDFSTPAAGAIGVEIRTFRETGTGKETSVSLLSSVRIVNP